MPLKHFLHPHPLTIGPNQLHDWAHKHLGGGQNWAQETLGGNLWECAFPSLCVHPPPLRFSTSATKQLCSLSAFPDDIVIRALYGNSACLISIWVSLMLWDGHVISSFLLLLQGSYALSCSKAILQGVTYPYLFSLTFTHVSLL